MFAIPDYETNENWTWFLATLGEVLHGEDDYDRVMTFVSDRSKGFVNAVTKVFPSAPYGFCLRHLEANLMSVNARLSKALREEYWEIIIIITYACTTREYDVCGLPLVASKV